MFEFIDGTIDELTPTYAVINNNGIGYYVNISLTTYGSLKKNEHARLFIHQVIREDAHLLFAFKTLTERTVFRLLITVSGVGANTARMMLSSMSPDEIGQAILSEDVLALKSIKGIGTKSAERIIVELKDKIGKESKTTEIFAVQGNTIKDEALSALVNLGFSKPAVEKVVSRLLVQQSDLSLEEVIKQALKLL